MRLAGRGESDDDTNFERGPTARPSVWVRVPGALPQARVTQAFSLLLRWDGFCGGTAIKEVEVEDEFV